MYSRALLPLICLGLATTSAFAQESIASGNLEAQASWNALKLLVDKADYRAGMALSKIQKIEECGNNKMLYGPSASGKDPATGCVSTSSVPASAVMAFALPACPTGWSEYTPARGRFIRGIDTTGSKAVDPSGKRTAGALQSDGLASHSHHLFSDETNGETGELTAAGTVARNGTKHGSTYQSYVLRPGALAATQGASSAFGTTETRPKNVALLFCKKD